ncbi:glycosyl transferase [Flavipsychrobacter stenotrophus]|uniref:Glycosyl transferase n=1 Tax=Flavipsychrobacter stenotrophus TaxID=2077091 RepID=A0A2S7SUI7_9BACT|nr:glycosyltransferase family A protein [Flavipsychrobacter stenotrophus]PQJ10196.1 glycosyl transferase [Flavipsychrobacter stenotrophus]
MLSIIIPTWNNLPFVKLCVESIRKNSAYQHQVVLHINDGSDGTMEWAKKEGIDFTSTPDNAGICIAVNMAAGIATQDYIVYMNDDMYVCPKWDTYLAEEIKNAGTDNFMFSSTMIEPTLNNPCVIHEHFGTNIETFDEKGLLEKCSTFTMPDWYGSTWPPTIVHKKYWHITGGYSIELSPGVSSDDDFAMKMWAAGCRIFKGIGKSRVYHFQSKSTLRIKKNDGRKQFLMKWGITQSTFNKYFTHRSEPYAGILPEPDESMLKKQKLRAWLKIKIA